MKLVRMSLGLALLPLLLTTGLAADGPLFRCSAKDVIRLTEGGTVGRFGNDSFQRDWTGVLINTSTGLIGRNDGSAERWAVIQEGSPDSDFVASPDRNLVSASTQVLRIQTWAEKHRVTFLYFGLSMFVTGVCDEVR
jgi:hypothetical protein